MVLKADVRGRPGTDTWAPERRKQAHFDEAHPREELPYAFPPHATQTNNVQRIEGKPKQK